MKDSQAPFRHEAELRKRQPSKAAKKRVRMAFDAKALVKICEMEQAEFAEYATRFDCDPGKFGEDRFFFFKDNGSRILAVAHLDTVQRDRRCTVTNTAAGPLVCSGGLDDRLGAYVILELLPTLGITCDWLLTTNEERCDSTAKDFEPDDVLPEYKDYNWIIEFDRGGTDVVMYQYESQDMTELVEQCGARVGQGSYSDIADLDHLGCIGFNWGVGYEEYHSARSHAWLDDTFRMVARFEKFYNANADRYLEYRSSWLDDDDEDVFHYRSWDDRWTMVADCGHEVNLADEDSWVEAPDKDVTLCRKCGTNAA